MKKFEIGSKYIIYMNEVNNKKEVGTIEILKRTAKFITYSDDFFGRTKKQKIEIDENGNEKIFAFYNGVNAVDVK